MTARLYHREHSFSGSASLEAKDIFDQYEQELFTAVVGAAEKEGKSVSLLVAAGTNVFDAIVMTAQSLQSSTIVCGLSNKLTPDEQGKLTGDAWERLPEPRSAMTLEIISPDGSVQTYELGPHTPHLRDQDLALLHQLWLELTANQNLRNLHHYHVVALALQELQRELDGPTREELLQALRNELQSTPDDGKK